MLSIASPPARAPPVVLARSPPPPSSPFGSSLVPSSIDSCIKDGRRIRVGGCALFQAGDAPPFIGLIRWFSIDKDDCLKVCVNWLYRPVDIRLPKGTLLEAAPNEVFYSFHKDVITAASLLHPCKIYFLRQGVELPAGISSFVCRRVYDIANKCLWWLTDQDYINERQEEVDQLLDKTELEMHAAVQSGGRSPKSLNGPTSTQQLKSGTDSVQNSGSSFSSLANKGKKRDRGGDQGTEPIKRERSYNKPDDVESVSPRLDMIKSEVAKITEKGALITREGCEKLVHLMQLNRNEKKVDLSGRIVLADVIAGTNKIECLSRIVQLRGLPVLDDWLQEAHKGKTGDGSSPKESDKGSEDLLFALLRALDKLPVNLNALQTCNIGKSVNHLRSHKNPEIQKKARSLVDTWKKRVDVEITKTSDAKSGGPSTQAVTLPAKTSSSDVPQLGSKVAVKTLISQSSPCNKTQVNNKHGHIDAIVKSTPVTPGVMKSMPSSSLPSSVAVGWKGSPGKGGADSSRNYSELPPATAKEEKNINSSQSQYNNQSCSSDHAKTLGSSCKEDLRSSIAGSLSASKTFGSSSGLRSFSNGFVGNNASGGQKDSNSCKTIKVSNPSESSSESARETSMDHGNNHRLVVRIPNSGRIPAQSTGGIPAQSTGGGSVEGPSIKELRYDDVKDGIVRSDADNGLPPAGLDEELGRENISSSGNVKGVSSLIEPKSRNSLNALIESFAKYSEPSASLSSGDDIGMNLLASVAAGEMSSAAELVSVSPTVTPAGSPNVEPCTANYEAKSGVAQSCGESEENPDSDSGKSLLASEKLNEIRKIEVKSSAVEDALESDLANEPAIDESKPADPTCEKTADGTAESSDLVGNSLGDKSNPADPAFEKTADGTAKSSDLVDNFSGDKCKDDIPSPGRKSENLVPNNSSSSVALINKDQKPAFIENHSEVCEKICNNGSTPSTSDKVVCLEPDNVSQSKGSDEPKVDHLNHSESALKELTTSASNDEQAGSNADRVDKVLERKEALENSVVSPVREAEKCSKSDLDKSDESTSSEQDIIGAKFDFDLNEGFSGDDADQIQTEPAVSSAAPVCSPPVHLPIISAFASCPTPNDTPASVTVTAPNEGHLVPPVNLLKTKGEPFGWKGSAATSAFQPADLRRVLEMQPFSTSDAHLSDTAATKQGRALLDFDLNVADLEDMASSSSSPHTTGSVSGVVSNHEAPTQSAGGLELDLNKVDEGADTVQFLGSTSSRKSFSGGLLNGEANMLRGFDLNNGPGVDEIVGAEPLPESQHVKNPNNTISFLPPIAGLRMGNNAEIGNASSWFPHGNSFQAVPAPSFLPDRQQHPYSLVAAPGAQRILRSVTGSISSDIYGGPVLSSSPAMSFSSATPFPHAGFPFGSSFPLQPSYSDGPTTYADSSQLVRPGNTVFSNYIRPYVPSLQEGSMNAGSESSRKWGGQGLDLNAGAGSADVVDVKDDRLPSASASRQLSLASSHMFGEEQARVYQVSGGGGLKRKEREGSGSWDERLVKQPSWQ